MVPWAHLVPSLPPLRRKLRAVWACMGIRGISEGLRQQDWPWMDVIHGYDVDTELLPALLALFGPEVVERFDIGPSGNALNLDIDKMADVDVLISGPPCPPFSAIGA